MILKFSESFERDLVISPWQKRCNNRNHWIWTSKLPFAKFSIEFSRIHPEITCSAFPYRRRKLNEGSRPRPRPRFRRCKARRGSGCSSAVRHGFPVSNAGGHNSNGLLATSTSTSSSGSTAHPLCPEPAAQINAWPLWPPNPIPQPTPLSSGPITQVDTGPQNTATPAAYNTLLQAKPQYSLFTATPMTVPANAIATEPPQMAHNVWAQILAEIQEVGSRGERSPNPSTSIFRTNISINHPLKPLLDKSLDTILQAVSPRTLQTYVTAWKCFKSFHLSYNIPFPEFSLLSITSFISFLNSIKSLQVSSIKSYISGIQFFHKLLYGAPSPEINNSQTALLIRGIQRSRPTRPDSRLPITLDILTKCIHALRTCYQPPSTARTLDTMSILAFFGFLRCAELTASSKFDPAINPTISDLTILDSETISFLIKQSKTDQVKKGHFVYIFNLSSPIQPYQAVREYLHLRISQAKSPLEPLFLDHAGNPVSRTWFQKQLKSVLLSAGISAANFSSHSFRIGAATSAAQKGLTKHQIQTLGRWSSEAFQSYIRTDQFHIKSAHQTLVS